MSNTTNMSTMTQPTEENTMTSNPNPFPESFLADDSADATITVCPACGKQFSATEEERRNGGEDLVCSLGCLLPPRPQPNPSAAPTPSGETR